MFENDEPIFDSVVADLDFCPEFSYASNWLVPTFTLSIEELEEIMVQLRGGQMMLLPPVELEVSSKEEFSVIP